MAHNTDALAGSMQRLETLMAQLEKTPAPARLGDDTRLVNLQAENAAMKKRHDNINTRLGKLIATLEQQMEDEGH